MQPDNQVEIQELTEEEIKSVVSELRDFEPVYCKRCKNKNLKKRYFALSVPIDKVADRQVKKLLKEKFNLKYYGYYEGEKNIIVASKCPVCGGERMYWDY